MKNEGLQLDNFMFLCILKACIGLLALEWWQKIHDCIISVGIELDIFIGDSLIDMYAKCWDLDVTCQVFDKISQRSVVT